MVNDNRINGISSTRNTMDDTRPLFSIGVTSYKRIELLRQCIRSILSQTCPDFEILIGNDDTSTIITPEMLGISDERIRIFNHSKNLGEIENMNYLLAQSGGKYFTIQADDDLYEPQFLESVQRALNVQENVGCIYTGFRIHHGEHYPSPRRYELAEPAFFSGSAFIHRYLEGKARLMPVCGVFRKNVLVEMGGIKNPSDAAIGLFGEYILVLSLPLDAKIGYIDTSLVMYRVQFDRSPENTGGVWNSADLVRYQSASRKLILFSARLFSQKDMKKHFLFDMSAIIALCMPDMFAKWFREGGRPGAAEITSFFMGIIRDVRNEVSYQCSFVVALLLARYLIVQIAYVKPSMLGNPGKYFCAMLKMIQAFLRGILFFTYRPPALFWRAENGD